jgi:hypothetical protein
MIGKVSDTQPKQAETEFIRDRPQTLVTVTRWRFRW